MTVLEIKDLHVKRDGKLILKGVNLKTGPGDTDPSAKTFFPVIFLTLFVNGIADANGCETGPINSVTFAILALFSSQSI